MAPQDTPTAWRKGSEQWNKMLSSSSESQIKGVPPSYTEGATHPSSINGIWGDVASLMVVWSLIPCSFFLCCSVFWFPGFPFSFLSTFSLPCWRITSLESLRFQCRWNQVSCPVISQPRGDYLTPAGSIKWFWLRMWNVNTWHMNRNDGGVLLFQHPSRRFGCSFAMRPFLIQSQFYSHQKHHLFIYSQAWFLAML